MNVIHECPPRGTYETPCCGRSPFEIDALDRMTLDKGLVTCPHESSPYPGSIDQLDA